MIRLSLALSGFDETVAAFSRAGDELPDQLEEAVAVLSEQLEQALQDAAPVSKQVEGGGRTPGGLRDSIRYDLDGTSSLFFASEVAWFVIGGTSPHTIQGNPLLHFYWQKQGGWVTFAHVQHPGTRPNDFRAGPMDEIADQADEQLGELGDWLLEALAS